jgi:hypothetical protein
MSARKKSATEIRLNQIRRCIDVLNEYRKNRAPGHQNFGVCASISVLGDYRRKMKRSTEDHAKTGGAK